MNFKKSAVFTALLLLSAALFVTCTVKYSLSGASISPLANTYSVAYFPNNAPMVSPTLSATLTDGLKERFERQTRLTQENENGDLSFEGEITNYSSVPAQISGEEYATQNRLTITVRVRFNNVIEPEYNFEKTFSGYEDYPTSQLLQDAEVDLIPLIVEKLVNDIFNAAVSNW